MHTSIYYCSSILKYIVVSMHTKYILDEEHNIVVYESHITD